MFKLGAGSWLALAVVSLAVLAAAVLGGVVFARTESTALEKALLEAIVILATSGASFTYTYVLAMGSARSAAGERVRAHSRPAFRRVLHLYAGLGRLGTSIEARRHLLLSQASRTGQIQIALVESALDPLYAEVVEQTATADDAMNDWRDLVPEEVAQIEAAAKGV